MLTGEKARLVRGIGFKSRHWHRPNRIFPPDTAGEHETTDISDFLSLFFQAILIFPFHGCAISGIASASISVHSRGHY